jgi:formylglycine-generating enzyme required for sulfatase activity
MANTFDWVEITTRNGAETASFYERLFGWRIIQKQTAGGSDVWIFDTGGEPRLENLRRGGIWERPEGDPMGVVVYVVVDDIEAVLHRARELGGRVITGKTPQGRAHRACFADPSGNRLGLWEESRVAEEKVPAELILIPGGDFLMGANSEGDHSPVHLVRLDAFYMDRYEVTNAQYLSFCRATGHRVPEFWGMSGFRSGPEYPNHPVVGVSWRDAADYAAWCGKRLPTEAEWEYAARGGVGGLDFPNGDSLQPSDGNYNKSNQGGAVAVGSYRANGFGLHDMQGNVVEWVADFYDAEYYASSPTDNPQGPERGRFRVIRGGGWHSGASCNKVYYRNALPPNWVDFGVGFRCAADSGPLGDVGRGGTRLVNGS